MFKCHLCSSEEYHLEDVSEIFQIDGKFFAIENVPATVCSHCGEMTFSRETTERIRRNLHGESKPIKAISVDVYAY
jgi:HTH-type transcriptional regulator / antitoxin MqsA